MAAARLGTMWSAVRSRVGAGVGERQKNGPTARFAEEQRARQMPGAFRRLLIRRVIGAPCRKAVRVRGEWAPRVTAEPKAALPLPMTERLSL